MIIEKILFCSGGKEAKGCLFRSSGLGVILGSMWLTNLSFGIQSVIIQKGLAGRT